MLTLFAATSVAGDNPKGRPFKATFAGEASWAPDLDCVDPPLRTYSDLEGQATHLGRTVYAADHCTAFLPEGGGKLVAANGDEIWFTYVTPMIDAGPVIVMQGPHTVVGGTGRFENAEGTLLGTIYLTVLDQQHPTWPLDIVLVGTLTY